MLWNCPRRTLKFIVDEGHCYIRTCYHPSSVLRLRRRARTKTVIPAAASRPSMPIIFGLISGARCTGGGLVPAQALVANAINNAPVPIIFGKLCLPVNFSTIEASLRIADTYNYLLLVSWQGLFFKQASTCWISQASDIACQATNLRGPHFVQELVGLGGDGRIFRAIAAG